MDFQRSLDLESQTIVTLLDLLRGFGGGLCVGIFHQTPAPDPYPACIAESTWRVTPSASASNSSSADASGVRDPHLRA